MVHVSQQDKVDKTISSLHEAMLGDAEWQATSLLLEEAFGAKGTHLVILDNRSPRAPAAWPEWLFDQIYFRGVERDDIRQRYVKEFFPHDERVPRMVRLPESRVVPVTRMFTERELKTSLTYNDALLRTDCQRGFNMRMDGPDGLDIILAIADPVDSSGWSSGDVETMEHLLPHIRQFIRVRHALVRAQALGTSLTNLLGNAMIGVIYLDRRGMIVEANSRAREILRRGDGLVDRDGVLRARQATDDARLGKLLTDAMPGAGRQPVSGSMTVERSLLLPRLVVHVTPVVVHQLHFGARSAAALVLIVDPGSRLGIDADLVGKTFRLTRAESQVAAALAAGSTVREIAKETFRAESSVRWLVKQIHAKLGISRQADLVRLVLSTVSTPMAGRH